MRRYMTRFTTIAAAAAILFALGCSDSSGDSGGNGDTTGGGGEDTTGGVVQPYLGQHVHTLLMGQSDNAEVIKTVPNSNLAILVSSKARKVTLLRVANDQISIVREAVLFENDPTESELTHIDIASDGAWAVATRTIIETDGDGAQTACGGELVFFDTADSDAFGTLLKQVEVGPMPDSVDISDDDQLVVSANERDGPDAWGKCEVAGATASISVIDVSAGPAEAAELQRIEMIDGDGGPREPEAVVFSADNDHVVCTLQDTHEVALFSVTALAAIAAPTSDDLSVVRLPDNDLGAGPWPDGIARFNVSGAEYFAIAGEWNDTFCVIDGQGGSVANPTIAESDLPESFPRVVEEGYPPFSPDSAVSFVRGDSTYVAFTLRHAGAVVFYDVTDPAAPVYRTAVQVGDDEQGGQDEDGSTIRPEGIAAASDGSFVLTANEEESSVSLIIPVQ